MIKLSLKNWLLPTVLFLGWMVGGCSQKQRHTPVRVAVTLQQMKFMPSEIIVHVGDTVVFTNKGIVIHDVTEDPGKAWTSGPIPIGGSFKLVIQEDVHYYCSIHPVMKGKITVLRE